MGKGAVNRSGMTGRNAGFTLVELMIAAGVLATSLGLLFGSLVSLSLLGQVAEGKTMATAYLSGVLEEVRQMPRDSLFAFSPQTPPQQPGYTLAAVLDALDADGNAVRMPLANPASGAALPEPVSIRVTVVYATPKGHVFSITSTTANGT